MKKSKESGSKGGLTKGEKGILKRGGFDISPLTKAEKEFMRRCEEERKKNYKVWEVSYNYLCDFEHVNERATDTYYVVAETIGKAEEYANGLFFRNDYGKELFDKGEVRRCIREYTINVPFPELSLESDVENFFIEARLGGDGRFANRVIEFVPRPYLDKLVKRR